MAVRTAANTATAAIPPTRRILHALLPSLPIPSARGARPALVVYSSAGRGAEPSRTAAAAGHTGSSSSASATETSSSSGSELQARPRQRQPRLPPGPGTDAQASPRRVRRWHRDAATDASSPRPPPAAERPDSGLPQRRPAPAQLAEGVGIGPANATRGAAVQRRTGRSAEAVAYDDDYEDDDEEGDLEFAGLSEEEIERMVFAQSRFDVPAEPAASKGPSTSPGGAAAAPSALSPNDVVAAYRLPPTLGQSILAAAAAGKLSGDALPDQLQRLAQAVGASGPSANTGGAIGADAAAAAAAAAPAISDPAYAPVDAAVRCVSAVLSVDAATAASVVLRYPHQYMRLSADEVGQRMKELPYRLGVEFAAAVALVVANPMLLLVPPDALYRKLKQLANATGLKESQTASMVTLYMFPEAK